MSEELTLALIATLGPISVIIGGIATMRFKRRREQEKALEKAIEILKGRFDRADDPAERGAIEQQLRDAEDDYLPYLRKKAASIARRVRSKIAPDGAIIPDTPGLSEPELDELQRAVATIQDFDPPETAEDHLSQGNAFYASGQFDKALEQYNLAHKLRPDGLDTLYNRGLTLVDLQRNDEALADFNRIFKLRPYQPDALSGRGTALSNLGRHDEALADFNRALELRPNDSGTLYNRACAYSVMGRLQDSLNDLKEAISHREQYREMAREDENFANLRSDPQLGPEFERLVAEPED